MAHADPQGLCDALVKGSLDKAREAVAPHVNDKPDFHGDVRTRRPRCRSP